MHIEGQLSSVTCSYSVGMVRGVVGWASTLSELILGLDFRGKGEGGLVCITYNKHQFLLAGVPTPSPEPVFTPHSPTLESPCFKPGPN
jgi:hypothetical protein